MTSAPEGLLDELLAVTGDARLPLIDALSTLGADAVPALIERLDQAQQFDWAVVGGILQRIGEPALVALRDLAVRGGSTELRRRAAWSYTRFGPDWVGHYATGLTSADPRVRALSLTGIGFCKSAALTIAADISALLGDPFPEVRTGSERVLTSLGRTVMPLLQQIRRDGPGQARRAALRALAEIGGPDAFDARDRAAVERLLRLKTADDAPEPISCCFLSWIAVRGGDQQGIADIMSLSNAHPATFAMGSFAADIDSHSGFRDDRNEVYARVFVTPQVDGWTLVVGRYCDPSDPDRSQDVLNLCLHLSARYGQAQAYFYSAQGDGSTWLAAENGSLLRRGSAMDGEECDETLCLGDPLPYEQQRRAALGLDPLHPGNHHHDQELERDEDGDCPWRDEVVEIAIPIAAGMSVDPLALGPHTSVRGTGLLALTPYGRRTGTPPGALPV